MFRYSPFKAIVPVVICASLAAFMTSAITAWAGVDDGSRAAASDAAKNDQPENQLSTPTVPVESKKRSAVSDKAEKRQNTEALKRRAGEKSGGDSRGHALMLGMKLQEGNSGFVKVVEVAAASPAFDAGIREGDVILSYQGFSADTYRKWIDGITRLTTDAQTGARIPVMVEREGKRMSLALRVPDRPVRQPTSVALAQKANQLTPGAAAPAVSVPSGSTLPPRGGGGGSDVLIDNSGLDNFFGDQAAGPNDRAIAHIFRLGGVPPTNPAPAVGAANNVTDATAASGEPGVTPQTNAATVGATPPGSGPRIGMAGFRDDPSGMVAMVDVGALAPGNYVVGIGDAPAGGITRPGTVNPNPNPNPNVNETLRTPTQGQLPAPNRGPRFQPNNPPAQPQPAPAGARQPQGNLQRSSELIPRTILAQVSDGTQTSDSSQAGSDSSTAGAPSDVRVPGTSRTGPVVPRSAPPGVGQPNRDGPLVPASAPPGVGQPGLNDAQRNQTSQNAAGTTRTDSGSTASDIGTLTVDQSGTGRLQKTVEGVQVRNVVGQAIVIYSMGGTGTTPQTTLPPNLKAGAQATPRPQVEPVASASGEPGIHVEPPAAAGSQGTAGQASTVQRVPVASGVIRLLSDRRPPPTETETTDAGAGTATGVNPPQQPATATPETGQNQLR